MYGIVNRCFVRNELLVRSKCGNGYAKMVQAALYAISSGHGFLGLLPWYLLCLRQGLGVKGESTVCNV